MLYETNSTKSFVVIQYLILELVGLNTNYSEIFKDTYFDHEIDAYTAIADKGEASVRYVLQPTCIIFQPPI